MKLQTAVNFLKHYGGVEDIVNYVFSKPYEFFTPDKEDEELTELKNDEVDYVQGKLKINWDE